MFTQNYYYLFLGGLMRLIEHTCAESSGTRLTSTKGANAHEPTIYTRHLFCFAGIILFHLCCYIYKLNVSIKCFKITMRAPKDTIVSALSRKSVTVVGRQGLR